MLLILVVRSIASNMIHALPWEDDLLNDNGSHKLFIEVDLTESEEENETRKQRRTEQSR